MTFFFIFVDVSSSTNNGIQIDDVKNESIKKTFPTANSQSEKHDELSLNLTRAEFYEFFEHVWNDVYWLAYLLVLMGFLSMLLSHHFDLRLQMVGARMRIACCSMIYRKVGKMHFIYYVFELCQYFSEFFVFENII